MIRPRLGQWQRPTPIISAGDHIVIFVHGILADASTFDKLLPHLDALDPTHKLDFWIFDYDWRQSLTESARQLADEIRKRAFGDNRRIDIVGHSMGGLVARMVVLKHDLPTVKRIVTLATPNHGTIMGSQLNLLGQMTTHAFRKFHPIYARAPGVIELTDIPTIIKQELASAAASSAGRLNDKSYVSIPAQFYHTKRQFGQKPPSLTMGGLTAFSTVLSSIRYHGVGIRAKLTPVHDGIVEERSNQLHPAPVGSSNEGVLMLRGAPDRSILHITHEAASDCDHVMITGCQEVADLIHAVLCANQLDQTNIDQHLEGPAGPVTYRPFVM